MQVKYTENKNKTMSDQLEIGDMGVIVEDTYKGNVIFCTAGDIHVVLGPCNCGQILAGNFRIRQTQFKLVELEV